METKSHTKGIHLGIIPDGSRRWARINGIKNYNGRQSGEVMEKMVRHVFEKHPKVNELSIWALSTDNLKRPEEDKQLVYGLLNQKIKDLLDYPEIYKKGIRVNIIGSKLKEMPLEIREIVQHVASKTKKYERRNLNICIGYGGKQEILDAVMAASKWLRKNPTIAKIHKNVFEKFLMIPRPLDIVIRTGGEKRLSGFMLYQIEYAELFFTDKLWPDFTPEDLDEIMLEFASRNRRFGR